jgi:hypothetical protein
VLRGSFVAAALFACGPLLTGCPTTQCQSTTVKYDQGELVPVPGGYAYETSPLQSATEKWVDFPGEVTLEVEYPPGVSELLARCAPFGGPAAWLGTSDAPNEDDAAVLTPNAGQTAQFNGISTHGFSVTNGSCASYSALFVVNYLCTPSSDAGTD